MLTAKLKTRKTFSSQCRPKELFWLRGIATQHSSTLQFCFILGSRGYHRPESPPSSPFACRLALRVDGNIVWRQANGGERPGSQIVRRGATAAGAAKNTYKDNARP